MAKRDGNFANIPLPELAKKLQSFHWEMNRHPTKKAINSESSSACMNWQRRNLGNRMIAVEIDMFKISRQDVIERFSELKRSYFTLNQWRPFSVDYNNFRVVSKLAQMSDIQFDIVYNRKTKNPCFDDPSQVRVVHVHDDQDIVISDGRCMTIHDFMND